MEAAAAAKEAAAAAEEKRSVGSGGWDLCRDGGGTAWA